LGRSVLDTRADGVIEAAIVIHQAKEPGRCDSFWYGGRIASLGNCVLIAEGDIRCSFPDGYVGCGDHGVSHARDRGYLDADLGRLEWDMNNWFEVVSDHGESVLGDVAYDYDSGIALLIQYVRDKVYA